MSGGSGYAPCREADRQADMMKLMITFCSFMNLPKNDKASLNLSALN
jgi:hypothetical protein